MFNLTELVWSEDISGQTVKKKEKKENRKEYLWLTKMDICATSK
jgi:hypothetical protein